MSDLSQQDKLDAVRSGLEYNGPTLRGMFEGLVGGIDSLLLPSRFGPAPAESGSMRGRGGPLDEIASNAVQMFRDKGELAAMQYLRQFQGQLTEDQLKQIMAVFSQAAAEGPTTQTQQSLDRRIMDLAANTRMGAGNSISATINNLIWYLPPEVKAQAQQMWDSAGGQVTEELVNLLEQNWGR